MADEDIHSWPHRKLGELAEFRNGINYDSRNFGSGMPVVGVTAFKDHVKPRFEELDEIDPEGVVREQDLLADGDILFVRSNGNRDLIGRSLYIERPPGRVTHSAFTIRLRFRSVQVHARFFAYLFRTQLVRQTLAAHGGGTNISSLNQGVLASLAVPVPPLAAQRRIAGVLTAYDDLIENCERRINVLDEMARALYREWFVEFRFPGSKGVEWRDDARGRIPAEWRYRSAKEIAEVTYGFPFKSAAFTAGPAGLPLVRIRDILVGESATYTEEPAEDRYRIADGEMIVGMDGDFHMGIWSCGPALLNQRVARFRAGPLWSALHFVLAMRGPIEALNHSIVGTTVAHLGDAHIKKIELIEPDAETLRRATGVFEPIAKQQIVLRKSARALRRTRDLLLPRLLSGQLGFGAAT
jgi:type I restriction enzyme S subunit